MELPLFGKVKRPLPWLLGLMVTGLLVVGATYFLTEARKPKIGLNKLTVPVQAQNLTVRITANGSCGARSNCKHQPQNRWSFGTAVC
jgi:HlyD family secretion protein